MADGLAGETGSATFGILGPLEVSRSGRMVPLGGPRQRAVLALLLLEANQVVSMDRLAEDIWGGDPPAGWATTVQTYVFHLRRALEPDRARGVGGGVLVTRGHGYLLSVNRAALDAGRYAEAAEMLRQALALWRSDVLADLADYAFIRPEAARLDELRLAALEARIDADLALGRHDAVAGELEHLAAGHPLRERLHGQLMLALYRGGRQAEALAAYRRARDLLAAELGIDPGEALQHLHQAVLAHDPALDWNQHRETVADDHLAHAHSPAPGRGAEGRDSRPTAASRVLGWGSGPVRRVLVAGLALAVTAAAIVAVTRPWAGVPPGLPGNTVGLIDAGGGRVGAAVSVGSPAGLAYGDGSIWAVDGTEGAVSRINPVTHAVIEQIPVGSAPTAVTVTGDNVWVTNSGDGTVSRINAAADRIVGTTSVGNVPVAIASGPSGVWVADEGDDTVDRINPATGKVTGKVQVGGHPDGIAVGPDAVWVANGEDGTVTRIDLATGQPGGPVSVGSGPAGIAITPAAVWVANSLDLTVSKIDPATDSVTRTIGVGDGPSGIVAARGALWVSDEFNATLDRIDPRSGQVTRSVFVGSSPQGLAATPSGVWVAARPFAAASHRGGTLTVVIDGLPEREPMNGFDPESEPALSTVYDGLVAQRRSGGAGSITLVPDLARTLPRPAGGGTVYTFTLRRGIHYSNGALIRASDFRRGIMRQLSFGDYPPYFEGILGGQACHQVPRRCDLSAGIITNDTAGTVTFHLDHADPDFLYKLALILAVPAPPGAPDHAMDRAPFLPGTGPYMISQYRPNVSFTLVRNRYFRQWSFAAQPAGYPSVIRYNHVASENEEDSAVIAGRADLTPVADNGQSLATRYPAQVHAGLKTATTYLFLNTRQPPFTSLKARQAVNYAIDRGRILQLLHRAPGQAAVTCQLLPADFPGHQPYCPYTTGTEDGSWHGPDMAKARQLAQESSTTNVPVTVWTFGDFGRSFANTAMNSYLVQLLNDLGYRARMRVVSAAQFFTTVSNAHSKIQAGLAGWGADFPTASGMIVPALSCGAFDQDPTNTTNYAGFCDPHAERLASQAQAAQLTDPATARTLWAQVDRDVTDQAPWAPIISFAAASFVSARTGNYQQSINGPLIDEMWVR